MTLVDLPAAPDAAAFRRALGHVPTAVSVVTAIDDDGPVGMTVGSFTSISLDPPLVGFFAVSGSATLARVRAAGRFCVNVLTDAQGGVSGAFAARRPDRFAGVGHHRSPGGAIRLHDALAWIECAVESIVAVGDHELMVGQVTALDVRDAGARPLVFFRGTLCDLDRRTLPGRGLWQRDHYTETW